MSVLELSGLIADVSRYEQWAHHSDNEEAIMHLHDREREREKGWRAPGVGNLDINETLLPTAGKDIGTQYEIALTFTESPVGLERSVGETESNVELRADYYGVGNTEASFVLREKGSEEYQNRLGAFWVSAQTLPGDKSLDIVDTTKNDIDLWGPPHSSYYLTLEFTVEPDAFES
ncbi:hypothetical protein [Halosimplex sp. J119]